MLYERYKGLKKRMEWLASEETTEFTRVAALNVLNQAQLLPGYSSTPPPTSFEADAFLQNVFGGPETQPTTLELNPQNHQNITPEQQFVIGGADSFPSALEQHQLLRSGITPFTERAPIPNYLADGDVEDGLKGAKPSKLTRQTILGAKRKQEDII